MGIPSATNLPSDDLVLPDLAKPMKLQSLPAWAASLVAALKNETHLDQITNRWREMPTLSSSLALTTQRRGQIETYIHDLNCMLVHYVPETDPEAEEAVLVVITEMILAAPGTATGELVAEAKGRAYLEAVNDLPVWAVKEAKRRWSRGDCGKNERGEPYDYRWCPASADLRRIAYSAMWPLLERIRTMERILSAVVREEYSDEYCADMRKRIAGLFVGRKTSPVGSDGSGE